VVLIQMRPKEILETVKNIQKDTDNSELPFDKLKPTLEKKYPEFSLQYPSIFYSTLEGKMDLTTLEYMVGMADQVNNKSKTQHDASVEVGQKLVDQFVKPALAKTK
jgi:hypothetical protein